MDKQAELERLTTQLKEWDHAYHVEDNPLVPDAVYDYTRRWKEKVEAELGLEVKRSVGSLESLDDKIKHSRPFLSLKDVFSLDELRKGIKQAVKKLVKMGLNVDEDIFLTTVEWKYDGLALGLTYVEGQLMQVVTRGNGVYGEDVTDNFKRATRDRWNTLPDDKDVVFSGEVRGEGLVYSEYLDIVNGQRAEPYSSERHLAAAMIRSKDSFPDHPKMFAFIPYDYTGSLERHDVDRQDGRTVHQTLINLEKILVELEGDQAPRLMIGLIRPNREDLSIEEHLARWSEERKSLPFLTDGLVFKTNIGKYRGALGCNNSHPLWAWAYKFPADGKWSVLKGVDWQVGRTGVLTPVACIDPIVIGGVTIDSPTLHNAAEIRRLGLSIGSKVYVERRGDVIPKIMYCQSVEEDTPIEYPTHCPACSGPITEREGEYYCDNDVCPEKLNAYIQYALQDDGFNIKGLGPVIIRELVMNGHLKDPFDVFRLEKTVFESLESMAGKNAEKVYSRIQKVKTSEIDVQTFVYALGLPGVGVVTAGKMVKSISTLSELSSFFDGLMEQYPTHQDRIRSMLDLQWRFRLPKAEVDTRPSVYISGSLDVTKEEAKSLLAADGYRLADSYNKTVDYLITPLGHKSGSTDKAERWGKTVVYAAYLTSAIEMIKTLQ